jgi:hypothetical protein
MGELVDTPLSFRDHLFHENLWRWDQIEFPTAVEFANETGSKISDSRFRYQVGGEQRSIDFQIIIFSKPKAHIAHQ